MHKIRYHKFTIRSVIKLSAQKKMSLLHPQLFSSLGDFHCRKVNVAAVLLSFTLESLFRMVMIKMCMFVVLVKRLDSFQQEEAVE